MTKTFKQIREMTAPLNARTPRDKEIFNAHLLMDYKLSEPTKDNNLFNAANLGIHAGKRTADNTVKDDQSVGYHTPILFGAYLSQLLNMRAEGLELDDEENLILDEALAMDSEDLVSMCETVVELPEAKSEEDGDDDEEEEEEEDSEKKEMKFLKKLDKKTDKMIKKDEEVHEKMHEEALDELNKSTLDRYHKKASAQYKQNAKDYEVERQKLIKVDSKDRDYSKLDSISKNAGKRARGMENAQDKLKKGKYTNDGRSMVGTNHFTEEQVTEGAFEQGYLDAKARGEKPPRTEKQMKRSQKAFDAIFNASRAKKLPGKIDPVSGAHINPYDSGPDEPINKRGKH